MRSMRSRVALVGALVLAFSSLVIPVANAYIDPGSGSFIVQMLIGAALGLSLSIKLFWRRLVSLFSGRKKVEHEEEPRSTDQ